MKLRFLVTTPSARPEYPFAPGQVIEVDHLTSETRKWIRDRHVEVLPDEPPEAAVASAAGGEQAVLPKAGRRRIEVRGGITKSGDGPDV